MASEAFFSLVLIIKGLNSEEPCFDNLYISIIYYLISGSKSYQDIQETDPRRENLQATYRVYITTKKKWVITVCE